MMVLQNSSEQILKQLSGLVAQFNEENYSLPQRSLSGSTIGGHVRHIVEFYECLLKGLETGTVNYDKRSRNKVIETDPHFTVQVLKDMISHFNRMHFDKSLRLVIDLSGDNTVSEIRTTYFRELAYNIEHAIHHMAIIKIATIVSFPEINIDRNFGVAFSTLNYMEKTKGSIKSKDRNFRQSLAD